MTRNPGWIGVTSDAIQHAPSFRKILASGTSTSSFPPSISVPLPLLPSRLLSIRSARSTDRCDASLNHGERAFVSTRFRSVRVCYSLINQFFLPTVLPESSPRCIDVSGLRDFTTLRRSSRTVWLSSCRSIRWDFGLRGEKE